MTHDLIGMKDFQLRRWVKRYMEIKSEQGSRHALTYVRNHVPPADQEMFGEYVRAFNKELLEEQSKINNKEKDKA